MDNKQKTGKSAEIENILLNKRILKLESKLAAYELISALPINPNSLYTDIFDNIPLAILSLDTKGNFQLANQSFIKLFDLDKYKIGAGLNIKDFKPFQGSAFLKKINALVSKQRQFDHEVKLGEIGNKNNVFRTRGTTILSDKDEVIAYMIIIGDITKRMNAEKNLIKAKEQAEEANLLKTAFLSNLSHEIRTPLNHILGFLELILVEDTSLEERQEYSSFVRGSSEDLLKRIDDIIDISKIETGQMDVNKNKIIVNDFLDDLFINSKNFQIKHKRQNVDFILMKNEEYAEISLMSDPEKLKQIIFSFIDNAFIFTDSGSVEVGFELIGNNGISFYVKDTGVGIDPQHHESIFEHFRQVDNSSTRTIGGSGLGLAISRGLAKLLGGNIKVKSQPGEGSKFYLTLPQSITSIELSSDTTMPFSSENSYDWRNSTILIAEYEEVDYNLLKVILSKTNAKILRAKTGDEAIRIYHENQPDLVLINFDLPVISGDELARILKAKDAMVPIIARINFGNEDEIKRAKESGIDKLITKPIQNNNLLLIFSRIAISF